MYLWHFSGVSVFQNARIPSFKLSGLWDLYLLQRKAFILAHTFSMGLQSGFLAGGWPPVNGILNQFLPCILATMLWIIILLKSVAVPEYFIYKWYQACFKNLDILCGCHNASKQHHRCGPPGWYTTPHAHFHWVFCPWFELAGFSNFLIASPAVGIKHHWRFICPDHIIKRSLRGQCGICIFEGKMNVPLYTNTAHNLPFVRDIFPDHHQFMIRNTHQDMHNGFLKEEVLIRGRLPQNHLTSTLLKTFGMRLRSSYDKR